MDNPKKLATLVTQDTGQKQTKQKQKHYYSQTKQFLNKTRALQETAGGKDEPNIFFYVEINERDFLFPLWIRVITKLSNSEQSYKGKVKTHRFINRQNQSTTGKLWKP